MSTQARDLREPTRTQKRIAKALTNPRNRTYREVAKEAGVRPEAVSHATRNRTVQRELARIEAAQGDTARALRIGSLSRALSLLPAETDPGRLSQIAVNAATVEEKVGSGDNVGPAKADQIALGRRLLLAWAHGRELPPNRQALVASRIEAMDNALAFYATVSQ